MILVFVMPFRFCQGRLGVYHPQRKDLEVVPKSLPKLFGKPYRIRFFKKNLFPAIQPGYPRFCIDGEPLVPGPHLRRSVKPLKQGRSTANTDKKQGAFFRGQVQILLGLGEHIPDG